mgnify:CR=1 FL=1
MFTHKMYTFPGDSLLNSKESIQQSFWQLRQQTRSIQDVVDWIVSNPKLLLQNAIYQRIEHGNPRDENPYIGSSHFKILSLNIKMAYTNEYVAVVSASGYPALYGRMAVNYSFKDIKGRTFLPYLFSEMLEGSGIHAENIARPAELTVWIHMWLDDWPGLADAVMVDKLKDPARVRNKAYMGQA